MPTSGSHNSITARQKQQQALLLEHLQKMPIIQIACQKVGIGRATYYRWRNEDKEFKKKSDGALLEGTKLICDMAESQIINAIREQNMTAITFWLRHHHETYKNRVEISGKLETKEEPLTDEQKEIIEKALRLASLHPEIISQPPSA